MIGRSIAPKRNSYILRATLGQFWACVTAFALNVPSACFFLSVLCAPDQHCSCNTVPTLDPLKTAISIYRDLLMSSASQLRPGQCPPVVHVFKPSTCFLSLNRPTNGRQEGTLGATSSDVHKRHGSRLFPLQNVEVRDHHCMVAKPRIDVGRTAASCQNATATLWRLNWLYGTGVFACRARSPIEASILCNLPQYYVQKRP